MTGEPLLDKGVVHISDKEPKEKNPIDEGHFFSVSNEIEKQLNKNKMLKVRILKSALQTETAKTIATNAAEQTDAALVEVRGHVFILYRRHKKTQP